MGQIVVVRSRRVARKANKVTGKEPVRVNYHLPADLVIRIDRFAAEVKKRDQLNREVTRTDAIRALIGLGLDVAEK